MTTHVVQQIVEDQDIVPLDPYCVFSGKRATLRITEGSVRVCQSSQGASAQPLLEGMRGLISGGRKRRVTDIAQ